MGEIITCHKKRGPYAASLFQRSIRSAHLRHNVRINRYHTSAAAVVVNPAGPKRNRDHGNARIQSPFAIMWGIGMISERFVP